MVSKVGSSGGLSLALVKTLMSTGHYETVPAFSRTCSDELQQFVDQSNDTVFFKLLM